MVDYSPRSINYWKRHPEIVHAIAPCTEQIVMAYDGTRTSWDIVYTHSL